MLSTSSIASVRSHAGSVLTSLRHSPNLASAGRLGRAIAPYAKPLPYVGAGISLVTNLATEGQTVDRAFVEAGTEIGLAWGAGAAAASVCTAFSGGLCAIGIGAAATVAIAGPIAAEWVGSIWERLTG